MTEGLLYLLWWLKTGCLVARRERRRWQRRKASGTAPVVFYGLDSLPGRGAVAGGGIIKCQDLAGLYPNTPEGANLLYLVSSAILPRADVVIRYAKRAGARVVVNQNGVAYPAWHGTGWQRTNRPLAAVLRQADHVIYQSAFSRMASDRFLGSCACPSEILHNPVDTTVFTPAPEGPPAGGPVLLVAGSHQQRYRVETALRTLAQLLPRLPGARLLVAGRLCWTDDEERSAAEAIQLARQLGVDHAVTWKGAYSQADATGIFRQAHLLLHPTYNDVCPRLVAEGLACGLPVVYSASGGVPELVEKDAGIGIPAPVDWETLHPPSPEAMAEAVLLVVRDLPAYSKAARQRAVSHLDVKPWLARHRSVFEALLS